MHSLRGQVILQWLVLVHLDKIIPADEVLFKVGGLSGGSTCHITLHYRKETSSPLTEFLIINPRIHAGIS